MSALSPAPAPALGARWTDLPNSLDSIYPSCCLSYKQSAGLSPLCFHGLTNCFSRKPFVLITICVAPGCTHSETLTLGRARMQSPVSTFPATHTRNSSVSLFAATHAKMASCKSFACHTYEKAGVSPSNMLTTADDGTSAGLRLDPMLDVRLQDAQGDRSLLQDGVVEGAHVELAGEAARGFGAQ